MRTTRTFTVPGSPRGKGRHRTTRTGRTYTDEKTAMYENKIMLCYRQKYAGEPLITGPVSLDWTAYFQMPQSASKKRRAAMLAGEIWPTVTPDRDNIEKIICDALNGVVWRDDKQVVTGDRAPQKRYAEEPRLEITIKEV